MNDELAIFGFIRKANIFVIEAESFLNNGGSKTGVDVQKFK